MAAKPSYGQPSEKQLEVLRYIISHVEKHGFQPTQAEMARAFGVTKNAIQNRLKDLARRGIIDMPDGTKTRERAIVIKFIRYRVEFHGEATA
jgi:SOS-response transcriptional repressor LexA